MMSVACVCGFLFLKKKDVIVPFAYSGDGEITMKLFFFSLFPLGGALFLTLPLLFSFWKFG